MKSLFRLVFFGLLVTGWGLAALSLHVVRTPNWIALIPKDRLGIDDTYVDTRQWTMKDASEHPAVVARLLATNQTELLSHLANGNADDLRHDLTDLVKHAHVKTTTPSTTAISTGFDLKHSEATVRRMWFSQ